MSKPSTPTVPVCEIAQKIPLLKGRIVHYQQCTDPRCIARYEAAKEIAAALAKAFSKNK